MWQLHSKRGQYLTNLAKIKRIIAGGDYLATDERENSIILLKPCYIYWPHARIYGLACGP
jgi:hypothetical protein